MNPIDSETVPACRLCQSQDVVLIAEVEKRPARENDFKIPTDSYKRFIYRCVDCDVFFNLHGLLAKDFYTGTYNENVYGHKLLEKYNQIMALPPEKSDNRQRVARIDKFLTSRGKSPQDTKVLDVGSGLCVFLGGLKERGYQCYALDPDPQAVKHAVENVKIKGGFSSPVESFVPQEKFDLITFNKVLEHVEDPVSVLKKTREFLCPGGCVYIELPDGECAYINGGAIEREEFFIEHFTVYSLTSMRFLASEAGFKEISSASIHEPSDKYTLFGFFQPS